MKIKLLILSLLFPLVLNAQEGGFTLRGCVHNGVSVVPGASVELMDMSPRIKTETGIDGTFALGGVPEGPHTLRVWSGFHTFSLNVDVHSDITLDTIVTEEVMLESTIWYLQKATPSPVADPYFRQYLDFRRAIDALNLTFSDAINGYNTDSVPDASGLIASLRGVTMEEGWTLDIHYTGGGAGGFVNLYSRRVEDPKPPRNVKMLRYDLVPHIRVDFTPEGIWSAYQLSEAYSYLPKYWHGGYNNYCGIFSLDEVRQRSLALSDSLATTPEIHTRVEILDGDHATVTAYWWNDWTGLFEMTVFVERIGETVNFIYPKSEDSDPRTSSLIIVPYDCGIMF